MRRKACEGLGAIFALLLGVLTAAEQAATGEAAANCVRKLDVVVAPAAWENVVMTVDGAVSRSLRPNVHESVALDFCETDLHHIRVNGAGFDVVLGSGGAVQLANNGFPDGVKLSKKGVLSVRLGECTFAPENKYYFEAHERFDIMQLLKSPMVMMCAPALLMFVMPYLVDKKEVAEMQNYPIVSRNAPFFNGAERRFECLPDTDVALKPIAVINED